MDSLINFIGAALIAVLFWEVLIRKYIVKLFRKD